MIRKVVTLSGIQPSWSRYDLCMSAATYSVCNPYGKIPSTSGWVYREPYEPPPVNHPPAALEPDAPTDSQPTSPLAQLWWHKVPTAIMGTAFGT